MATPTPKEVPMEPANGTIPMTKGIEANVKEAQEATAKVGKALEANVKEAQEATAKVSKTIEANVKEAQEAATKAGKALEANVKDVQAAATDAGNALFEWMRKLPLASLGLAAVMVDETKVVVDQLFMGKLVERGERVQKDAGEWMKDVQARFR